MGMGSMGRRPVGPQSRAAGRATIVKRGRRIEVSATELDRTDRVGFFGDILGPLARSVPGGTWFVRIVDGVDLNHPVEAADGRYVFELRSVQKGQISTS